MLNIKKNIPVFFLWLASLAIVAHMIIPHDHHLSESDAGQNEPCPASENQTGHKTGFPIHCHAFNDIASDKARPIQISPKLQLNTIVFQIFSVKSEFEFPFSCECIIDLDKPLFNYFALNLSLLRAPPVFV